MYKFINIVLLVSYPILVLANPLQIADDPPKPEPVKECTKAGLMCESCSSSAMCVKMGETYKKVSKIPCAAGSTCMAGTCTKEVNPTCDYVNVKFPCQYQGAYPHPGDWSKYVYCVPDTSGTLTAYTVDCEPGTGYNAKTTYCSRNLSFIDSSVFPIERCLTTSLTPLVHPDNPSIYYICSQIADLDKLYPIQFTCPMGGTFALGECTSILTNDRRDSLV